MSNVQTYSEFWHIADATAEESIYAAADKIELHEVLERLETEPYPFTVDGEMAGDFVGYSSKQKFLSFIRKNFKENVDYKFSSLSSRKPQGGRPRLNLRLSPDCLRRTIDLSRTIRALELRRKIDTRALAAEASKLQAMREVVRAVLATIKDDFDLDVLKLAVGAEGPGSQAKVARKHGVSAAAVCKRLRAKVSELGLTGTPYAVPQRARPR